MLLPRLIQAGMEKIGVFQNIHRQTYESSKQVELYDVLRDWYSTATESLYSSTLLRKGEARNKEEAADMTGQVLSRVKDCYAKGVVPYMPLVVVLGRMVQ
jgi:hypothetical protein